MGLANTCMGCVMIGNIRGGPVFSLKMLLFCPAVLEFHHDSLVSERELFIMLMLYVNDGVLWRSLNPYTS